MFPKRKPGGRKRHHETFQDLSDYFEYENCKEWLSEREGRISEMSLPHLRKYFVEVF
jgi:hypothetical protein